jgi:GPI-anchor transamidase subunit S
MTSVEARKKAPPEKPEAVSLRTKIVFSFWAIIICLGLPVWHQTTSIYRATLPLDEMLGWADSAVRLLHRLCFLAEF